MCAGVGGLARLERDVIAHKPTLSLTLRDERRQLRGFRSRDNEGIRRRTCRNHSSNKGANKRANLCHDATVYDGTRHTPWSHTDRYNEVLDRYSQAARELANREKLAVIDLHSITTAALHDAKSIESSYTFLPDGVHPEPDGQLVIAAGILKAWAHQKRVWSERATKA